MGTDIKVDSVVEEVKKIEQSGGQILTGPFDIKKENALWCKMFLASPKGIGWNKSH